MEFFWAKFLRDQLDKDNNDLDTPKKLMDSYPEAIRIAAGTSDEAGKKAAIGGFGLPANLEVAGQVR
jgi:hypothetical protein